MFDNILSGAIQDENKIDNKNDTVIKGGAVSVPFSVSASDNDNKDNINDLDGSRGGASDADDINEKCTGAGSPSKLPADFINILESIINSYCQKYNIESPQKMSGQQWRSACYSVGEYIKQNNILLDKEKSRRQGGRVFDIDIISSIIDIFGYMCGNYKKVPLKSDFVAFAGVSWTWLDNWNGNSELTSSRGKVLKKLEILQESGIASGIVNDNSAPVGKMFFSKCVLGWNENGQRVVNADADGEKIQGLPDLGALMLPKNE